MISATDMGVSQARVKIDRLLLKKISTLALAGSNVRMSVIIWGLVTQIRLLTQPATSSGLRLLTAPFSVISSEARMYGQALWLVVEGIIFIYLGYVLIKPEKF